MTNRSVIVDIDGALALRPGDRVNPTQSQMKESES